MQQPYVVSMDSEDQPQFEYAPTTNNDEAPIQLSAALMVSMECTGKMVRKQEKRHRMYISLETVKLLVGSQPFLVLRCCETLSTQNRTALDTLL